MKIRNNYTGAEYISDSLMKTNLGIFIDEETTYIEDGEECSTIFNSNDGWEEVKEDVKWHDIRKNPNDLPSKTTKSSWVSNEVIIAVYNKTYNKIETRSAYYDYYAQKFFLCVSDTPIKKGVIAWCDMPEFKEE